MPEAKKKAPKFRRFSVIYTTAEQAAARIPYDQWMVAGSVGQYTDPKEAQAEAARQAENHSEWRMKNGRPHPRRTNYDPYGYHSRYLDWDEIPDDEKELYCPYKFIIRGVPLDEDYRSREEDRIAAGDYVPLGNEFQPYYSQFFYAYLVPETNKISYFETEEKAKNDKRTQITASRFLRTILCWDDNSVWDTLDKWGLATGTFELKFAHTREEIRHVYENGPESCMSHVARNFGDGTTVIEVTHPTEVYASPDIEVAYMERDGTITGRAVCNRHTKEWVRIYGDTNRFNRMLEEAGYQENPMCLGGCRLLKIFRDRQRTQIWLPYLDGVWTQVEVRSTDREYIYIKEQPILVSGNTTGYAGLRY